jgi:hypothetical protein
LRVHAERREETKTEEKGTYRSEFRYGSFTRAVSLPTGATEKDVKATYKDGIREVRVPIDHAVAESKKIPIQRVKVPASPWSGAGTGPASAPLLDAGRLRSSGDGSKAPSFRLRGRSHSDRADPPG